MMDSVIMQERIGQLCGQFKLPTMGAKTVARFTAAGHGDALPIFLEVLERVDIQSATVRCPIGFSAASCLDFTHFKPRKRERLQLNGTG